MAPRTNRPQTGLLVCLTDPLPDRDAPVRRCVDPSCEARDPSESSSPREAATDDSERRPRFGYLAGRRSASIVRTDSPNDATTPTNTPGMDRPIEERVS